MNDMEGLCPPQALERLVAFSSFGPADRARAAQDAKVRTGALLRALAASKPGGRFLELGTGLGHGTAWILDGMDPHARLVSVDREARCVAYAREHIDDPRAEFLVEDAGAFLKRTTDHFDLVFADAYPGKLFDLELAVAVVAIGGFYVIDDMTPLPHWSQEHRQRIEGVTATLERIPGLTVVKLAWATGLVLAVKQAGKSGSGSDHDDAAC